MTITAYAVARDRDHEFPKLEAEHGEDPARFLGANRALALARIDGIREPDLLRAYDAVERKITDGNPRAEITAAIADRAASLGVDELTDAPTPDTDTTPATATDGGTAPAEPEPPADDTPDTHADADGLESGEVLVVDRKEKTEYVFPTTAAADAPYLSRAYDTDTGDLWMELAIDADDYRERLSKGGERRPLEAIAVDVPQTAASNDGGSE